ncbi:MAG: SAF domain-containing protein, partial [Solirubrobacterales bacterium]
MSPSRRGRAIAFGVAAALCAGLAASAAGGGPRDPVAELGELREVVVARRQLPAGRRLRHRDIARALETRRVPARFLPPGALTAPAQAIGRVPGVPIPAGGYVLESHLDVPGGKPPSRGERLDAGRRPVEIAVSAAAALAAR